MNLHPLLQSLDLLDRHPPSLKQDPARRQAMLDIGRFLETNIRSGQPFDLKAVQPNPLWQAFEERLRDALLRARDMVLPADAHRIHQWYSSGVVSQTRTGVLGFDIIPMRRLYGWEDRFGLTEQLADWLDALFITHRHEDHYDAELVRACMKAGKPVYMPELLASKWKDSPFLVPVRHDDQWETAGVRVHARTGIHVWRESESDLPLCVYEVTWPDGRTILYGGDVDYTKSLAHTEGADITAFFLPWRAPNARYEEGHERRMAPLHEAVQIALDRLNPAMMFYEHCAELEHVYDGFPASFDMAYDLKKRLPVASELLFWGEWMDLPR